MSRDELQVFRSVFERRSFSAGARALGLDPSAASRRIRALERRLGVALFVRSTRRVAPTEAAEELYDRVSPALDAIAEAELAVSDGGDALRGPVRVAAPGSLGRLRVAPVVHRFARAHPQVRVHLLLSDRRIDLIEDRIDLAVRVGPPRGTSHPTRRIGTSAQWVVAAVEYLAGRPPLEQGLVGHAVVLRVQDGVLIDVREGQPEEVRRQVPVAFASDDLGAVADAVRAGLGIAVLPRWLVADEVAAGELARLPLGPDRIEAPVFAVLPRGRRTPARVRALLDDLVEAFAAL
jgi:DNA-binding transcriptional LysR family regulator